MFVWFRSELWRNPFRNVGINISCYAWLTFPKHREVGHAYDTSPYFGSKDIHRPLLGDKWSHLTLEYYRFLSRKYYRRVCQTRFSKIKKIPFPSTAVYHKNYTENISLTEQFEHLQSYFTLIWYDFWWKVSRPNIAKVSGMPKIQLLIKKAMGVNNFSFCILLARP